LCDEYGSDKCDYESVVVSEAQSDCDVELELQVEYYLQYLNL